MKTGLKIVVAIILMIVLLRVTEPQQVFQLLAGTSPGLLVAAIGLSVFGLLLSAQRWQILLQAFTASASVWAAIRLYWVGSFFSNYLPTNVGGDVARAMLTKPFCSLSQAAASILVERMTGLVVLLVLAAIGVFARPDYYSAPGLAGAIWLCIVGMAAAILIVMTMGERFVAGLQRFIEPTNSLTGKLLGKLHKLAQSVNHYHSRQGLVVVALLLSVPFYASVVVFQYVLIEAVGGHVSLLEVLFIAPLIPLVSLIPASINSIGIAEGAFVALYAQAGLTPEEALAAALLRRVILLIVSLVGGVLWMTARKRDGQSIERRV